MPNLPKEIEDRMNATAETTILNLKYLRAKRDAGEEFTNEDLGMLALGNMFMVLYAIHVKGEPPEFALKYFDKELTH